MRGRKCSSTLPDGMEGDFIETEWNLFCFLNVFGGVFLDGSQS